MTPILSKSIILLAASSGKIIRIASDASGNQSHTAHSVITTARVENRLFNDDGETPNHPHLPLVITRVAEAAESEDPAAWFEQRFVAHDWLGVWRWTVYPYHHYHSTNHEVLGVSRGHAQLMFGGKDGEVFHVRIGDVIVIPAGVGHARFHSSDDFQVVGAYPRGEEPDLIRSGDDEIDAARHRIAKVAFPEQNPIYGKQGPLLSRWRAHGST